MSFEKLLQLNVNDKVEKKGKLSYLSWSYAWQETKKIHPNATYEIKKFLNKDGVELPYMFDPNTGYMVMTSVTIDDLTHEMWLPVMDFKNKAMIDNATMFEINKTIMRCLTKNLAMFGLGLYIYAGEDLPEEPPAEKINANHITALHTRINNAGITEEQKYKYLMKEFKLESSKDLDVVQYKKMMDDLNVVIEDKKKKAKKEAEKDCEAQVEDFKGER